MDNNYSEARPFMIAETTATGVTGATGEHNYRWKRESTETASQFGLRRIASQFGLRLASVKQVVSGQAA